MTGQERKSRQTAQMNDTPLQRHALTLLRKEGREADPESLYLTQAASLIPELLEIDGSRPSHQSLLLLIEELPARTPALQLSVMMGLHPASTREDIAEMTSEMTGIAELDELALLIADNLLGVLSR